MLSDEKKLPEGVETDLFYCPSAKYLSHRTQKQFSCVAESVYPLQKNKNECSILLQLIQMVS